MERHRVGTLALGALWPERRLGMKIGVDLGGTRIKAGLVDARGVVVERAMVATPEQKSAEVVVGSIAELLSSMLPKATSVGLAAAGVLDHKRGVIRESPNFPEWQDVSLGDLLASEVGLPVSLENDANAVIWGEACHGAGQGASNLIGYALGTGVGGALVLDGRLWRGERGMAGELGHTVVVPNGHPCGCGGRGCLEQYAGAVGLWRELAAAGYSQFASGVDGIKLASVAARAGDAKLLEIFQEMGWHLGVAMAGIVQALDVSRIVLAGGLSRSADLFYESACDAMKAHAFPSIVEGVEVVVGTLREDAGIIGAAALS